MKLPWMSRRDRRRWQAAANLDQLGGLMALWLEGHIDSWPGYQPGYGPDEETHELIPALAAVNRAGYVTTQSQPGAREVGADGAFWLQRAAVEGFISDQDLLRRLADAAETAGLEVVLHRLPGASGQGAIPVTTRDGEIYTAFGGTLSTRDLRLIWRGYGRQALDALHAAAQVTLVDRHWGPSTRLWDVLTLVAAGGPHRPGPDPDVRWDADGPDERALTECLNCGAPYSGARPYCSERCEIADNPDEYDDAPPADQTRPQEGA